MFGTGLSSGQPESAESIRISLIIGPKNLVRATVRTGSCCRPFPWLLSVANLMGRVWEGATAPLPIEYDVSEANSFWGVRGGVLTPVLLQGSRVIHRRFLARADLKKI